MNCLTLTTALIVLFIGQSSAHRTTPSPIIPGYPCPPKDIAGGCKGPTDCLYPNTRNCSAFIQCNDAGIAYNMPCAVGTEWNDDIKRCDWPENSTCRKRPPTTTPSTTTSRRTHPPPVRTTRYPWPIIPFPCPAEDVAGGCKGPKDCLYPNPRNCSAFIQCNDAGLAYDMPCAPGTEWNDNKKECDWPENSTCRKRPITTPKPRPPPVRTTPGRPHPPVRTTRYPWPIIPFPCPAEDVAGGCKGPKDCLYPNPRNCSAFIQCNDAGLAYDMPCAPGTEWNDNKKECDWPENSTCRKRPITTTRRHEHIRTTTTTTTPEPEPETPGPDFTCPEKDIEDTACMGPKDCLYPHPDNCNQFIHCEVNADNKTGRPTVKDCPAGLEWNDDEKICDWPENSTCPGTDPTPDPDDDDDSDEVTTIRTKRPTRPTKRPRTTTATPTRRTRRTRRTPRPTTTPRPTRRTRRTRRPRTTTPGTGCDNTTPNTTPKPDCDTTPTDDETTPDSGSGGFRCPVRDIIATKCMGPKDCLYQNNDNCNTFIQCTVDPGERSGTPVVMPCPAGLKWNNRGKICDWPANATCKW